ncbi:zinc-binding alcohol dehydrogenase family protein [Microvirga pudoricolor]|uniref:zinc-binding alcohol dehydrogenase family protein n=1 Tax=Microvirga pudoricolor TaxID=2778729 RepID=UPI001951B23C|nr:zinc-binding alcohol dehydrogenase family protein [Microvirga pudoricolor]MBM6594723.1 zinc-binding alcohol dehydrogenase family protein [Microvirga pudoricolor]
MKAVICQEPGRLEVVDRPGPGAPPEGFATVDIRHVGICGTDYHIFEGKHPFLEYPRIMGHELSGVVAASGSGTSLRPGTPVIVNPYLACGTCVACRKAKPNCCTRIQVLGVHTDGGMCERIVVPEGNLYPAEGLSLRDAAMVEFLAIGAHAVRRSLAPAGSRALVVGIGPIGLGTAIFARIAGHDVTLLDTSAERLAFADERLWFGVGVRAGEGANAALMALSDGDGFDVVFDATGHAGSIRNGFALVAHGGAYVLVSVVKDDIAFSDPEFHKREMMLIGSRNAGRADFEHVIASIRSGLVPLDALATHTTSLDEAPAALARWSRDKSGLIKAIVAV